MLSFASGQALTLYGFRDLVGASTALVAVAADVPPVHPLRPSLLPAPLDIVVATPPRAFRQLTPVIHFQWYRPSSLSDVLLLKLSSFHSKYQ